MSKQNFQYNSNQTLNKDWGGNYVTFNPRGHVYIFLDKNVSDNLCIGWETEIRRKDGDGNIRFTLDNGVYLNCMIGNPQSEKNHAVMYLKKVGESEFHLSGDIKSY